MKKLSSAVITAILILTAPAPLAAQNASLVPHITQLQTEARGSLVRLTWADSPGARGPVYIYRSARPFSGAVPPNVRPVTVRYGVQYYIDDIEDMENVYYFVAASDTTGYVYDLIIPQVNSINVNLNRPQASATPAPAVQQAPPPAAAAERIDGISNLTARQEGESVVVTFSSSHPQRNTVLYRSMQPVRQPQDLLGAIIVQTGVRSPFTDFPVPGISWYYAVIYEDEITGGNLTIRPGVNATASAVVIYAEETAQGFMRPMPLPILTLDNTPEGFMTDRQPQVSLGEEALFVLNNTQAPAKAPLELRNPRVFTVDLEAPASGEESALYQIISSYFQPFDWEGARVSLQNFLSLPRSPEVEARARFYLGQAFYFTGYYREALFEFLSFRSFNPDEANNWIDTVLLAMVH